jgi:predicted AAA+ superfamily ATPase
MTEWLAILETTGQILSIQPYFENFGKRLIKSPKVYFVDSGVACHLLGIASLAELKRSTFAGAIFEGFVAAEIVKQQINAGRAHSLHYFRDQRGLEIDFIVSTSAENIVLIEAKASRTVYPANASRMLSLAQNIARRDVQCFVVHEGNDVDAPVALAAGAKATSLRGLLASLADGAA